MNCRPHPYQGCALPTELPGPKPLRARSRFEVRGCFPSALGLWLSAPYALERVMGIEPTPSAWKAEVLPLNYTRIITNGGVPTGTTALGAAGPRTAAHAPAFSGAARLRRTPVRFASSPERVRRRPCIHLVEGGGFEPPKAEPSDLQSDPFDRSGTPPKKRRYSVGTAVCCQLSELTAKSGRRSSDTKTRVVAFRARMAGSGIYAACR